MVWDGEYVKSLSVIEKRNNNWKIEYQENTHWVIQCCITDLRPVIIELVKPTFGLTSLPCIWTRQKGRCYILYKLEIYEKINKEPTDEIKEQVRRLYAFQQIMMVDSKCTFVVYYEKYAPIVCGIGYKFTGKIILPENILQKWFHPLRIENYIFSHLNTLKPIDRTELLEERILPIVKKVDGQYVWYISDILNNQIISSSI